MRACGCCRWPGGSAQPVSMHGSGATAASSTIPRMPRACWRTPCATALRSTWSATAWAAWWPWKPCAWNPTCRCGACCAWVRRCAAAALPAGWARTAGPRRCWGAAPACCNVDSRAGPVPRRSGWWRAACRVVWDACCRRWIRNRTAPWRSPKRGSPGCATTASCRPATAGCCSRRRPHGRRPASCARGASRMGTPRETYNRRVFPNRLVRSMGRGPSIEARQNAVDAQRGKIFTKIIREIGVAARAGGGDPGGNPRLRTAIDKGLGLNMSKDVIERAIKKATGELEGVEYEEIRYEGYAPGGVAVIVDCLTDNRVRTVADVRHAFGKFGGNLGTEGSVAFMFRKLGVLSYGAGADEEKITEAAIEGGADDVLVYPEDGAIDVLTAPESFAEVKQAMEAAGLAPDLAEVTMRADNDIA